MDRFELDGKVYVAEDHYKPGCGKCALLSLDEFLCFDYPCQDSHREDGREIIWVEEVSDGSV